MKLQEILTNKGSRFLLLDDKYDVVDEVKRFLKHLDACGKSTNTLKNYAYQLKIFYEYMNEKDISPLYLFNERANPIDVLSNFMLYLEYPNITDKIIPIQGDKPKRCPNTINTIMQTVLQFYNYLADNEELVGINLYKKVRNNTQFMPFLYEMNKQKKQRKQYILKKRVSKKDEVEFITREQFRQLMNACNNNRDKLIVSFMFECAMRESEVVGLHICDVFVADNKIKIVSRKDNINGAFVKNGAEGTVFMTKEMAEIYYEYILNEFSDYDSDYAFVNLKGPNKGRPIKAQTVIKLFERLSKKVGFNVHPHMCRHGFATEKISSQCGWSLAEISAYLRHTNIQSTMIYTHYTDEFKKEKIKKLEAEYSKKSGITYGRSKENN